MAVSDASLVNQPVFQYTRMRTRKVGGGNAENTGSIPAGRMRGRGGTGRFKQYNSAHD